MSHSLSMEFVLLNNNRIMAAQWLDDAPLAQNIINGEDCYGESAATAYLFATEYLPKLGCEMATHNMAFLKRGDRNSKRTFPAFRATIRFNNPNINTEVTFMKALVKIFPTAYPAIVEELSKIQ